MKKTIFVGLLLALVAMAAVAWGYRREAAALRLAADLSKIVRHPVMPETASRTIVTTRKQNTNAEYYRSSAIDERW